MRARAGRRLTVLLLPHDRAGHVGLEVELLRRARRAGLAGATVLRCEEGFGSSHRIHRARLLSADRPLEVVLVDQPERIDAFLESVRPLLTGVATTLEDVEIVELADHDNPQP